jgi:uncharacterized protein DUF3311
MNNADDKRGERWSWWYLFLLIQFAAVLWPPFYNSAEPAWLGMPFFYWYQLLWVLISTLITALVYLLTQR